MTSTAQRVVEQVAPSDGWFHDPSTTEELVRAMSILLEPDIEEEQAVGALNTIIGAIANEYGD